MADFFTTDLLGTGQYPMEIPSIDLTGYTGPDLESPSPEPVLDAPVAIGGTIYTQNPDGSWDGLDGSTFTNDDFQNYKDSVIAIGDTEAPGEGGEVGGVAIPVGLTPPVAGPGSTDSTWEKYAKQFGLIKADGTYDLKKLLALGGGTLGAIGAATQPAQTLKSISELRSGMPAQSSMNATGWTPAELVQFARPMQTGSALQRVYAADMPSTITPGRTYAEGGEIEIEVNQPGALTQAFAGGVNGEDGGQSDLISIQVSPGEYVMDAESVSALGDGNTQAGIAKLDELRQRLRAEKRAAPVDEIPSQARGPLSYMRGG